MESPNKLVLDLDKLKEAFGSGKPDQDVDVTCRAGGSSRIGAEDSDPLGIISSEYRNDRLPYCPG